MNQSFFPQTIPESKDKQAFLQNAHIPHLYLGQGLIFTPPETADIPFQHFLKKKGLPSHLHDLSILRKMGNQENEVYYSPTCKKIILEQSLETPQHEAFGTFIFPESQKIIEKLFSIRAEDCSTFQCDNLMMALEAVVLSVTHSQKKNITHLILPEQYTYSGYKDFFNKYTGFSTTLQVITIPSVQADGSQNIQKIEEVLEKIKKKDGRGLFIDQEYNNNASGYDRHEQLNDSLLQVLKQYSQYCVYFGDIAYKGLKETLYEPYPLLSRIHAAKEIESYFYCSFSKITNYRSSPSFKNILFSTQKQSAVFHKISRSMGIGGSSQGVKLMYKLIESEEFQKEVETLRMYLWYITETMREKTKSTDIHHCFSESSSGIFRCLPESIAKKINAGQKQIVTVGERINIWPLGDPTKQDFFLSCL